MINTKNMYVMPKDPLERKWKYTDNGIVVNDWDVCKDTPILFLDIDGVLNDIRWKEQYLQSRDSNTPNEPNEYFPLWYSVHCNVNTVFMLKEWLEKTGTVIVLTSSWRSTYDIWLTFAKLNKEYGFNKLFPYIIGQTCRFNMARTNGQPWVRGHEIQAWLDEFQAKHYCIVDDDCDMLPSQLSHFIQINSNTGLTKEDLNIIEGILKK